jgi:hypothetical protein
MQLNEDLQYNQADSESTLSSDLSIFETFESNQNPIQLNQLIVLS